MNRSGMACCPFHADRTPSLKVYNDHFYCFGCGATDDCTGFTAKLFGISQPEAAKKISYDFGLQLFFKEIAVPVKVQVNPDAEYVRWLNQAERTISKYLNKLYEWRRVYSTKNLEESLHPLFAESLQKTSYVQYLSDLLTYGIEREKRELYKFNRDDILQIQKHLDKLAAEERSVKRKAI